MHAKEQAMQSWPVLWLFLFWLISSACWGQPLDVEFELRRDVATDGVLAEGEPQRVKVVLAADYLEFTDNDGRVVHDFVSYQSHLVNGDDYVRRSLYADIGFRVAEAANRLALLESLREADPTALAGEEVTVEHLFAIDDEQTEANLSKTDGALISYGHKGRLLAEFSTRGRALTAAQSKAFVRFLRYYCGGHPDILSEVQVRSVLPEQVRIDVSNVSEVISYRLRLLGVEESSAPRPDFSALRPTVLPPEPIGTLVALGMQLDPKAVEDAVAVLRGRADQAFAQGSVFEAALLYFEVLLMQGGPPPEALTAQRARFEADANAKALFDALLTGGQNPAQAVAQFQALEAKAPGRAHVLKIFRAGMLMPGGELVQARDLFLEALRVNPAIVGAWKDLGDIYHSNYETDMAWLCWDIGRRLSPQHDMLRTVNRLEQALLANYPGFF